MIKYVILFFQKYYRWEFLPSYVFDTPIYLYRLYLSIKSGSLLFFSNINPGMIFSGFAGYGKYDGLKKFDSNIVPKTILFSSGVKFEMVVEKLKEHNIDYPFIAKPDMGRTGRDVKKIKNTSDITQYLRNTKETFLAQEYIDYPLEFGVFYYRMPGEDKGHITGIVKKTFMFIKGDGKSTFGNLVMRHHRAKYYYKDFEKTFKSEWKNILGKGQIVQLNYLGNHVRGSVFYDNSFLINSELENLFDNISKQVDGFYFGRYDIKVKNIEDLYKGNFKILELNGAGSLPMHVYDPSYGILKARKCFLYHRKIIYQISQKNYNSGYKYMPLKEGLKIVKKFGV